MKFTTQKDVGKPLGNPSAVCYFEVLIRYQFENKTMNSFTNRIFLLTYQPQWSHLFHQIQITDSLTDLESPLWTFLQRFPLSVTCRSVVRLSLLSPGLSLLLLWLFFLSKHKYLEQCVALAVVRQTDASPVLGSNAIPLIPGRGLVALLLSPATDRWNQKKLFR